MSHQLLLKFTNLRLAILFYSVICVLDYKSMIDCMQGGWRQSSIALDDACRGEGGGGD